MPACQAVKAGTTYFGLVFAAGFILGTIRVTWLIPSLGEWAGSLIELPVILLISWIVCGAVIRRYAVSTRFGQRAVMGGVAFGLLMAAEVGLAILVFGDSPSGYAARLLSPLGLIGLTGQMCFALFPLWRLR